MLLVRRIVTGILVAASLSVLFFCVYLLGDASESPPAGTPKTAAQYAGHLKDIENVVIILLGITGLYIIVFIVTADVHARATRRQVDGALKDLREQLGASLTELQKLKEETRIALRAEANLAADRLERLEQEALDRVEALSAEIRNIMPLSGEIDKDLRTIHEQVTHLAETRPSEQQQQELQHYEGALPFLELFHSRQFGPQLAHIYRALARYQASRDPARARFYLNRAATLAPEDFETANELGALALEERLPDYRGARKHFEASLAAQPNQQRAKYGLAVIATAEGDLDSAQGLLDSAVETERWEASPNPRKAALVHYTLARVLARRARQEPTGHRAALFIRATQELQTAFAHPSRQLDDMLARDIEDDGDFAPLANTLPYSNVINDLLLNVSVGAA
jgi:tetratricopeptide (TPR) repeat protein